MKYKQNSKVYLHKAWKCKRKGGIEGEKGGGLEKGKSKQIIKQT